MNGAYRAPMGEHDAGLAQVLTAMTERTDLRGRRRPSWVQLSGDGYELNVSLKGRPTSLLVVEALWDRDEQDVNRATVRRLQRHDARFRAVLEGEVRWLPQTPPLPKRATVDVVHPDRLPPRHDDGRFADEVVDWVVRTAVALVDLIDSAGADGAPPATPDGWREVVRRSPPTLVDVVTTNAAVRAGNEAHEDLRLRIAAEAARCELEPWERTAAPEVDVGWRAPDGSWVIVEVKATTEANEVERWRLGLGQVIDYRHAFGPDQVVRAAVALTGRPRHFDEMATASRSVDVHLVEPSTLDTLFALGSA